MPDPCRQLITWLPGRQMYTEIIDAIDRYNNITERRYTKKQAEMFLRNPKPYPKERDPRILWEFNETERHNALFCVAILMGKLIAQELLDEDVVVERLMDGCSIYWRGNAQNDMRTILDGIKRGKLAMEDDDD
jgi:hypothetical protein